MAEGGRYSGQFRPEFSRLHGDRDLFWVVPIEVRYMIGLVGERFSGKSAAVLYLTEKRGFESYTLSDALRLIAAERGIAPEPRSNLQRLGNEIRREHDSAYLARRTLRRIRDDHLDPQRRFVVPPRIVVSGFKHPEEVKVFSALERFKLARIEASQPARFERGRRSGILRRELDDVRRGLDETLDVFEQYIDLRDRAGGGPQGQSVAQVMQLGANDVISNEPVWADDGQQPVDRLSHLYAGLDQATRSLDEEFAKSNA